MREQAQQTALVVAALRRIDRAATATPETVHLLAGGLSGSSVYRFALAGEQVVLKVTPPGTNGRLIARAHREIRFYHDLSTRVPLPVPRVLGAGLDETAGAVLLLAAYEPSPPPHRWTEQAYARVAQQLGRFHATFWGAESGTNLPGWLQAKPRVTIAQCEDAVRRWRALSERDDLHDTLEPLVGRLNRLLMSVPELDPRMSAPPLTLCHGDCHAGNLLQDTNGEWIWADWQEVRLGHGVDDLVFFWQRAFAAADICPPYDAMVEAYHAGLNRVSDLLSREQLVHDLAWAELRSWLIDWPDYLGALPGPRIQRVLERVAMLIDRFEKTGEF